MGWFSRSTVPVQQQENTSASQPSLVKGESSASPTAAATAPPTPVPVPALSAPVSEAAAAAVATATDPQIHIQQTQAQAQTQPEVQGNSPAEYAPEALATAPRHSLPAQVMEFDEYKASDDIFDRFKVSDAMNQLAACSSLGSNIRNYYRYGTYKDCADRYDHLKFCLSIKTKSSQVAQVMIQKRDAELRAKKRAMPNSEDVWIARTHPPEELVRQARDS
ncbi:hypothetical protein BC939DRAFT_129914 [Gamsiella multidivaricata]|uniref:uncharacterized protein n=1 Tax=Gamsiella multidivaricata TaxID=101098 RepID=UPI00221E4EC1|nr:uncharacterized protein BC939DRAFT_129914 [Gamsiella multidivaricata]KAI7825093.1 hypothetical protein BC939DRAFT_129914 [Gamsiella multidivaricata]